MKDNKKDQFKQEAEIFKALAHPTRLYILHQIQQKRLSVKQLSDAVGIDISTMSKHLNILKRHKIIEGEKSNNKVFYRLKIPCVLDFMSCAKKVLNTTLPINN
jgi:ArsR family transcriptional regulator